MGSLQQLDRSNAAMPPVPCPLLRDEARARVRRRRFAVDGGGTAPPSGRAPAVRLGPGPTRAAPKRFRGGGPITIVPWHGIRLFDRPGTVIIDVHALRPVMGTRAPAAWLAGPRRGMVQAPRDGNLRLVGERGGTRLDRGRRFTPDPDHRPDPPPKPAPRSGHGGRRRRIPRDRAR